jgi:AcrR family transcriptional regulator
MIAKKKKLSSQRSPLALRQTTLKKVPQKAKKAYHHGDLRAAIIDAAVHLTSSRGDVTFSLREIAASISVTHAAVYRHFKSKRAVLAAVAEEGYKNLITSLASYEIGSQTTTKEVIRTQFKNYVSFALQNPGHFRAMFHQELSEKKEFPSLEKISTQAGEILMHTANNIAKQMHRQKLHPDSVALAFWSLMHGFSELALSRQFPTARAKDKGLMDQRISEVIEILLSGLVGPEDPELPA